jgi:pyruvate/2-oxoglutarate/acetoin dehydrogenase E1 component
VSELAHPAPGGEVLTYHEARTRAIARELTANPDAVLIGGSLSLPFNPPDALAERFAGQVLVPPYSEFASAGVGVGAAIAGLRPLVALSTASFMFYAWSAVVNEAPLVRYLSGGAVTAPVAFHVHGGSRRGGGPQHEHTPQAMLQNIPGLRVIAPGTPADIDAAIHLALTGPDPTVVVDHVQLAGQTGPVPAVAGAPAPALLRDGGDALLVCSSIMTARCLAAAASLAPRGVSASVLNLPVIAPAPVEAVLRAAEGHRLVLFADECRSAGSPSSLLMARLLASRSDVRAELICAADAPAPFALELLDQVIPTAAALERALLRALDR